MAPSAQNRRIYLTHSNHTFCRESNNTWRLYIYLFSPLIKSTNKFCGRRDRGMRIVDYFWIARNLNGDANKSIVCGYIVNAKEIKQWMIRDLRPTVKVRIWKASWYIIGADLMYPSFRFFYFSSLLKKGMKRSTKCQVHLRSTLRYLFFFPVTTKKSLLPMLGGPSPGNI